MTIEKTKKWYTIKVQSNCEKLVSDKIRFSLIRDFNEEVDILIPTQNSSFVKNGKLIKKEKLLYPGYIFVETSSIDKISHLIKNISGASTVLKDAEGNPITLRQSEVSRITDIKIPEEIENKKQQEKSIYNINEEVTLKTGPFEGFKGKIEAIDKDKVKIQVIIFGRITPVEAYINDITK